MKYETYFTLITFLGVWLLVVGILNNIGKPMAVTVIAFLLLIMVMDVEVSK